MATVVRFCADISVSVYYYTRRANGTGGVIKRVTLSNDLFDDVLLVLGSVEEAEDLLE
jgi:hypothetical protein